VGVERELLANRPGALVVVGDVTSTMAAALAAAKLGVPVAHVEAGLRSFDLSMPEEINRMVTDRLSALLFTPSRDADENLRREGVPAGRIHFVGNVMIDTLLVHRSRAPWAAVAKALGLEEKRYALLTLHRPANVDEPDKFRRILANLRIVARDLPILFPEHPRTTRRISEGGLASETAFLRRIEPLGYLEFLAAMDHAALVLTDSGGIQEETTYLGVPCFTLRDNTERPVTIRAGTNTLLGLDPAAIAGIPAALADRPAEPPDPPPLWDGRAAERIADVVLAGG
jgi:UDP-N-acetylglucosamine 2-epimerase (non-hydrolysing)